MQDDDTKKSDKTTALDVIQMDKILPENMEELKALLQSPTTTGFLEFITGFGATALGNPSALVLSGGHILEAATKGKFYSQCYNEINNYIQLGKTPKEKLNTDTGLFLLRELLESIDDDNLDQDKFEAIKTIFLRGVWEDADEKKQLQAYQYMKVCRKLDSLAILVLKANYLAYLNRDNEIQDSSVANFNGRLAAKIGLPIELIEMVRNKYMSEQSLIPSLFTNAVGGLNCGLTTLGIELAKFIDSSNLE